MQLTHQALPIFLDRLADPVTAVLISITVVLIFGEPTLPSRSFFNKHDKKDASIKEIPWELSEAQQSLWAACHCPEDYHKLVM